MVSYKFFGFKKVHDDSDNKVYCQACNKYINKEYFEKHHVKRKRHIENSKFLERTLNNDGKLTWD